MPLTAAQEALSNEQILGHIVDMLMHERSQATRTAALSCLRVNRTWYYQVITRLWSDTRAFTVRGNRDPTLDPELSNILNRVRKEERQRHAGYIKKARIYGCRYLDQGSGAHSKDLCDLEFPNLRTIELYITDSHQQFPLGFFPEVRQVTLRSSQENGLFSIDVIMIGAIRLLFPNATKIVPHDTNGISPSSLKLLEEFTADNRERLKREDTSDSSCSS